MSAFLVGQFAAPEDDYEDDSLRALCYGVLKGLGVSKIFGKREFSEGLCFAPQSCW